MKAFYLEHLSNVTDDDNKRHDLLWRVRMIRMVMNRADLNYPQ
jgi:hypothetical protein